MVEATAKALCGGEWEWETACESDAEAQDEDDQNQSEGHSDYGYPRSREKFRREAKRALIAARLANSPLYPEGK
jgi:hypothetical protein